MLLYEINLLTTILRNELLVPRAFCLPGLQNQLHFIRPGTYYICKISHPRVGNQWPKIQFACELQAGFGTIGDETIIALGYWALSSDRL